MYAIFGKTYLVAAELYLGIGSFAFRYAYLAIIWMLHYILEPYIRKSMVQARGLSPDSPLKKHK